MKKYKHIQTETHAYTHKHLHKYTHTQQSTSPAVGSFHTWSLRNYGHCSSMSFETLVETSLLCSEWFAQMENQTENDQMSKRKYKLLQ